MGNEIIAALIGAVAAVAAGLIPLIYERLAHRGQQYKFVYVKLIHLRRRQDGTPPIHQAFIPRLKRSIDVYDEYHFFRLNVFHRTQKEFSCSDRTSGVVDLQILQPWQEGLRFADRGAAELQDYVKQTIRKKSSVFLTKSIYYNALQDGHEDIAMGIECDTDEARIIVDFSSLPRFEACLLSPPEGRVISPEAEEVSIGVAQPYPGVYSVSLPHAKEGQVIRIDFKVDWEKVEPGAIGKAS